jgi:isoleucyl-tRNA synthetase
LPSNQFAAVHPDLTYVTVQDPERGQQLILAEPLSETIAGKVKRELEVVKSQPGSELIGKLPPSVPRLLSASS